MDKLINEYINYLSKLNEITRPKMPRIITTAYTDNEYLLAIDELMNDFDKIDDLSVTLRFLKERDGS